MTGQLPLVTSGDLQGQSLWSYIICIPKIIIMGAVATVWWEKTWICYVQLKMNKNEGLRTPESGDSSFVFYQTLIYNPYGCICELKLESDFISWMLIKLDKI